MLASADLLLACSKKFRAEAEVVELELLTTLGKSKTPYRAYFGLVSADETVEVVLYRKDTIIMAYRSAPEGVRMYSEGSKEIVLYPKFHMTPVATFGIARNLDGGFETSFGFYVAGSLKEGMAASQKAWDSPYLTTKAGLLEYLCAESQRAGRIPSGFVREGKTTVLKITYFDMDTPETSEAELHFGDANVLTGIQSNLFQVRNIRYGRKSAMKLAGPKWPDVKVRTAESTTAPFKATSDMIAPIMKLGQLFVADE
jgi:hypothetical protein